jgi:hypothetical protein
MHVTARPFAGAADLQRMLDFIAPLNAHEALSGYIHAGDVLWRVYQNTLFDPFRSIRLWEDGHGSLLGFAWHEAPDGVLMQVAPNLRGTGLLERPMLAWAAAQVDLTYPNSDGHLWTYAWETDHQTTTFLVRDGFARSDDHALKGLSGATCRWRAGVDRTGRSPSRRVASFAGDAARLSPPARDSRVRA